MNTEKTETKERWYEILEGPNKDMLFDACKYAYAKSTKLPVEFTVVIGYTRPKTDPRCAYIPMAITEIRIISIEHENGTGECFNLQGYCKADVNSSRGTNYELYRFKAYYNSRTREGRIMFEQ